MNEQKKKKDPKAELKKFQEKVKTFWSGQTKKKKTILISSIAAILVISAVVVGWLGKTEYVVLYPQLDKDETIEVVEELKSRQIDYKETNGSIEVPADKEASLRMELANAGHPKTSPNYDFFIKNVDMMTTSEERKIIEKFQLDQKLGKVIKEIDGIKSATVTITLPDTDGYALSKDDKKKATAGVTITMSNENKELEPKQVKGIKKLVSSSVPNLNEKDVTVVDTVTGLELSSSGSSSQQKLDLTQFKFVVEKQFEDDVTKNIEQILKPLFGEKNVKVAVKSVIDIDKKIQEIVTYTPSQDNKGVIVKEDTHSEQQVKGNETNGGVPGTDTNTDEVTTYPGVTKDGNTIYIKDDKAYEYLVSNVKEQIQRDSGDLKNLTISVAINREAISEARRIELKKLVANAAAVDEEKVVVYNDKFSDGSKETNSGNVDTDNIFKKYPWLLYAIIGVSASLLIAIILATIMAKRKKKKLEAQWQNGVPPIAGEEDDNKKKKKRKKGKKGKKGEEELLPPDAQDTQAFNIEDLNIQEIKETKEQAMKREIVEFTNSNPEITAQLVKSWLKGDDD